MIYSNIIVNEFSCTRLRSMYRGKPKQDFQLYVHCSTLSKLVVMRVEKFLSTQYLKRTTDKIKTKTELQNKSVNMND